MTDPLVSVIIIEFFSLEEIESSIYSIRSSLSGIDHEIIVSSNSCYDGSIRESARKRFPGIIFSFNDRNGGFAYGMNRGLKKARGQFLVIANPDTRVLKGFNDLIGFLEIHPDIGAAGPQMMDSEGIIQDSCRKYLTLPRFITRQLKRMFQDIPVWEKGIDPHLIQTVDWVSGAFIVVTRQSYEETGGLDENYFLYAEDIDWCTRIRSAGFEIVYYPSMIVRFEGTRTARKFNKFTLIFIKSHLRYWHKFGFFAGYPERRKAVFNK
jgi:N-acetylglucosaminyl-diphospho-decaprenol L-rhamnosyltransferase